MNAFHALQRRNGGGSRIFTPMLSNPILSTQRRQENSKTKLQSVCRRSLRPVGISLLVLALILYFWNGTVDFFAGQHLEYSIVFDAGSTGSRVHAYSFSVRGNGESILLNDDFQQLKPGLSSYAGNPNKAAESLLPLLQATENSIPENLRSITPCELRATAGLRLLPGNEAEDILQAVTELLMKTPYLVTNDSISILDGRAEAAYAWLTVNYLLEKLNNKNAETVVTIDLGGGSVQESYEMPSQFPNDKLTYSMGVHSGNSKRLVYVHSYLSYGLMAARSLILNATISEGSNPCIPTSFNGTYKYGDEEFSVANKEKISALKCKSIIKDVLDTSAPCGAPADQCTFQGVWGGPRSELNTHKEVYLFSYFWDRAVDVGIVSNADSSNQKVEAERFIRKSHEICALQLEQLNAMYRHVEEVHRPYLCMDLSFISVLLMDGFRIDPYHEVTLAKQINYRGQNIETAWTLGAAIDGLSRQAQTDI